MTAKTGSLPELSAAERARYTRQIMLPEIGLAGQRRLKSASVLIIGAGGLGSPAAMYLAAAGVGRIGIVDFDKVDLSNLHRQILHTTARIGTSKSESAKAVINALNPEVQVISVESEVDSNNVTQLIESYDLVVDASDNFASRYVINDACVKAGKPNVYGAIYRFEGQASLFVPGEGPCYRCIFPEPPPPDAVPNCAESGVFGVIAGVIGTIQATETIKRITGIGASLNGRLLTFDALTMHFDTIKVSRSKSCSICKGSSTAIGTITSSPRFRGQIEMEEKTGVVEISPTELNAKLKSGRENIVLLDVRGADEHRICHLKDCQLIPLSELPERLGEIDKSKEVVCYCKMGGRSRRAAEFLSAQGFRQIKNLSGGILAWINQVDQSMQEY